jgi:hypothetical protein
MGGLKYDVKKLTEFASLIIQSGDRILGLYKWGRFVDLVGKYQLLEMCFIPRS